MAARYDEDDGRQRQLAVLQHERFDVTGEMMDADEGQRGGRRGRFREGDADEQRSDETWTLRDGHGAELAPGRLRTVERALDDAADVTQMLPRGELRDDAAPLAVDRDLRCDHVRSDRPRLLGVAGFFDDRSGGLVAGGFDAENAHTEGAGRSGLEASRPRF